MTSALRSYAFASTETLGEGSTRHTTTVTGTAVRPSSIDYILTAGHTRTEVRVLGTKAYVKHGTQPWQHASQTSKRTDPLTVLLALLRTGTATAAGSGTLDLTLTPAKLLASHLLDTRPSGPVTLHLSLDPAGHATALTTTFDVAAKRLDLHVALTSTYSGFDAQAPLTAPL